MIARVVEDLVEVRMLLVEHVDDQELRDAVVGGGLPDPVGADFHAVGGIGDDEREVRHAQGAERFGDEVRVARAVDDIEFFPQPFRAQQGGMDGDLVLLFVGVEVGDGGADSMRPSRPIWPAQASMASHSMVLPLVAWPMTAKLRMSGA